ncbi:MAG: iron-containing alcohol dehydrogenase, partial [Paludibacteraceae bacterium]|nr:iron-containing alcohol dehydrogenase [Paludibacteraceae bacterium]
MNQRLIESPDIVATLVEQLKSIDAKRVFLLRGTNSFIFCGAADAMKQVGAETGVQVTEFCEFSVNPKDEEAHKGLQILLDAQPDVIIAIGGGSVMDMAKLIRHYGVEQGIKVPLWAIPTTAGTGAEATHFAV